MNKTVSILIVVTAVVLGHGEIAQGNSIRNSKHDLSSSSQNTSVVPAVATEVRATRIDQVCVFCHTPHNARQDIPYLWNRAAQSTNYDPYYSSTMKATVGQPTGASKLCLSCHDGTIALDAIISPVTIRQGFTVPNLSGRSSSLGSNLRDDHPISFLYTDSQPSVNELVPYDSIKFKGLSPVQLDDTGQLQCTACHDPHDNAFEYFLVMPNHGSALCITCHIKSGWAASTHATSTRTYSGTGTNPFPNASTTTTVADKACGNCHAPHTAGTHQRLLKQFNEGGVLNEDNCLACHGGQVATQSNIANEVTKTYRHSVTDQNRIGVHAPEEDFLQTVTHHVECEDCHNPHQVKNTTAAAPLVSGRNIGVQGITATGAKTANATNLYEICFKCHGDTLNNVIATPEITRQFPELNTRLEFNASLSSHPVIRNINNTSPSLLPPYNNGTITNLYCTDCHGSDNQTATGAHGPHGSSNKHLLVANYNTLDGPESADAYALCYKCHNRSDFITVTAGPNFKHFKHVVNAAASCATCHDSHSSSGYGRLINFNTNVVEPNPAPGGGLSYTPGSPPKCTLICHTFDGSTKIHLMP
jgi:predicted CXXCH cytochrome family protein